MTNRNHLVLSIGVAVLLSSCASLSTQGTTLVDSDVAPEFTLSDHAGREVSLNALREGGPVVLVFFRGPW